jgi:hypothetical protein
MAGLPTREIRCLPAKITAASDNAGASTGAIRRCPPRFQAAFLRSLSEVVAEGVDPSLDRNILLPYAVLQGGVKGTPRLRGGLDERQHSRSAHSFQDAAVELIAVAAPPGDALRPAFRQRGAARAPARAGGGRVRLHARVRPRRAPPARRPLPLGPPPEGRTGDRAWPGSSPSRRSPTCSTGSSPRRSVP